MWKILLVGLFLLAGNANASFTPKAGIVEDDRAWYQWREFKIGQNISYWALQIIQTKIAYASELPIKDLVWKDYPELKKICACESAGQPYREPRQFNSDKTPLWGNDPKTGKPIKNDVGMCQISLHYHGKETKRLGLDVINSEEDNVSYAKILYDKEGSRPWNASKKCHGH